MSRVSFAGSRVSRFLSILDNAKTYEGLDEKALSKINYYEGAFYSKIMFEDSGNEVQYYHNRYEQLKEKSTILEWRVALKGLIQARLHAVTNRKNGHVDYRAVKDPKGLMEHIELLLQTPLEEQFSYFDYMQKNRLFHHWIQLAKVVEKPLDKVKVQLIYWVEMEEQKKKNYNPEPYYYLRAVCYLLALEGYAKEIEYAREYDRKIHEYDRANLFSSILANRYVLRDIIVEGRGMSKLVDVTNVSAQEYVGYLHSIKKKPMLIQGHIRGAMNQSTLLADAFQPIEWNTNIEFRIDIGKKTTNSLTEKQVGHTVRYYAGFSINHPMAVSDLIRDIDAGESLDWSDLSQTIEQSVPTQKERKGKDDPQSKVDHPKKKTFSPVKVTPVKEPKQVPEISMKAVADNALPDLRKQIVSATIHDAGGKNPVGFFIYNGCEYRIKVVMINGKKAEKVIKDAIESKRSIRVSILQNSQEDGFYVGKLST